MVLGIVGVPCFVFGIALGPAAIMLGAKSRSTLVQYGVEEGQGRATAAMVLGVVDLLGSVLWVATVASI
jgi:hypothetical protein